MRLKTLATVLLVGSLSFFPAREAKAIAILEIIKQAIVKVIKAVDLQIQRQQNKVIWLQNAQKQIENTMSKLRLDEISEWTEKQKQQYAGYFEELKKVKVLITYYQRVKEIGANQVRLVNAYKQSWSLLKSDENFTERELRYMAQVYTGILGETVKNIEAMTQVINSFNVQMSDSERLEIINAVGDRMDANYRDLLQFNKENVMLSLQRARSREEVEHMRKIYGVE